MLDDAISKLEGACGAEDPAVGLRAAAELEELTS